MKQLEQEMPRAISETDFDNYIVISDDCIVKQPALEYVRNTLVPHEAATGWCSIKRDGGVANVTFRPLRGSRPGPFSVTWAKVADVLKQEVVFRTWFGGMCLTGMRRYLWERFPYRVFEWHGAPLHQNVPAEINKYWGSDYSLSRRLQDNGVGIFCHKLAFVYHLATVENLIVGRVTPSVIKEL
jgi:hypothetical protein